MRNPAADEANLTPADFWCDFCHRAWDDNTAMVEGHRGSLICDRCLRTAYAQALVEEIAPPAYTGADPHGPTCVMCLEHRTDALWRSPAYDDIYICARCIKQAADAMEKDPDLNWQRPQP